MMWDLVSQPRSLPQLVPCSALQRERQKVEGLSVCIVPRGTWALGAETVVDSLLCGNT